MTNTIEVPVDLIMSGDITALRELLPASELLFGRWAEHPEYGRGMICSAYPNENGFVRFAYKNKCFIDGTDWERVRLDDLTLDPIELTTAEDYDNAPEGTIVEDCFAPNDKHTGVTWQKTKDGRWRRTGASYYDSMPGTTRTVFRYGWGK